MKDFFHKVAEGISKAVGSVEAFLGALVITLLWLILGPLLHFSDTWQLIISTISSAVTFLMVFLIQYAQNKDTKALHLKLDELIRTSKKARDTFVNIEEKPDEVIQSEIEEFKRIEESEKNKKNK